MADFVSSSCAADAAAAPFKTVALVGKYQAAGITAALRNIAQCIVAEGYRLVFERETALNVGIDDYPLYAPSEIAQVADVAVVLGGDGTMLGISRELAAPAGGRTVPLIGVNLGRLGFMTDIRLEDLRTVLPDMLAGRHMRETRTMLEAQTLRDGVVIDAGLALNDVVLTRAGMTGMLELAVTVGGEFMYNQRSDGLIVSTPTGSTAYALAAGGPILHPALAGIVLVPIAPHALSNRPIVLPHDSEVEIEVVAGRSVSVHFDMQELNALLQGDRIVIRRSEHTVCFLHPRGHNHFATLRNKLHWHEQ